jgi:threonine/homoserine efflux transporter RhtA
VPGFDAADGATAAFLAGSFFALFVLAATHTTQPMKSTPHAPSTQTKNLPIAALAACPFARSMHFLCADPPALVHERALFLPQ